MLDSGEWWFDKTSLYGDSTNATIDADLLAPAFWLVKGSQIKITRTDDSNHTALLNTSTCLGFQTFRTKITGFGNFRNGAVWTSNQCLGSCNVGFGGQYATTVGFWKAECVGGQIQEKNKIGFWCDYDAGDGAVMMIGGGGSTCERADHGIGVTEAEAASFRETGQGEQDFGDTADGVKSTSYALNLWVK